MIEFFIAAAIFLDPSSTPLPAFQKIKAESVSSVERSEPPGLAGVAVTLECTARVSGRVEDCKVLEETHPGLGFGEAALSLMQDAEVEAQQSDIQFAKTIVFTP